MPEAITHNQFMIDMARRRCLDCRERQCQQFDPNHSFTSAALRCMIGVGPDNLLEADGVLEETGLGQT